ncbi:MAG: hypothetical protein KKH92_04430 [Firmicutes bacterium]|nr:hypothetical protein [Bacillota bacterium]
MKWIDQMKLPIHKDDLMPVIRQGIFMSFTGGLLIGALHAFFTFQFGFSLTWLLLFILAHLTATRIRRSYNEYHILYSILSIFFFLLAYYLMSITLNLGVLFLYDALVPSFIIQVLNPLQYFKFINPFSSQFYSVDNMLELLFFLIGTYYAYRYSK